MSFSSKSELKFALMIFQGEIEISPHLFLCEIVIGVILRAMLILKDNSDYLDAGILERHLPKLYTFNDYIHPSKFCNHIKEGLKFGSLIKLRQDFGPLFSN